jgi:hypothetical protein
MQYIILKIILRRACLSNILKSQFVVDGHKLSFPNKSKGPCPRGKNEGSLPPAPPPLKGTGYSDNVHYLEIWKRYFP